MHLLDGQIARIFALENASNIGTGHPRRIQRIGRIADQSAGHDLLPSRIDRWYPQPVANQAKSTFLAVMSHEIRTPIKHAEAAAVVFKEHGALKFVECWGDDVLEGKVTSFPMAVKRKNDETVVFSWIIWPSRNVRDEGMKKVMADPRLKPDVNPMPFDGKRMIYGGFEMIVEK